VRVGDTSIVVTRQPSTTVFDQPSSADPNTAA
jgi:hypothetical protein